jgi:uncharacterized protein (UPF0335 family)
MNDIVKVDDLKNLVSKIESLEDEKKEISDQIKDVYSEAKSKGYEVKILKNVIKLRKKDRNKLAEEDELMETYREALGL